MNHDLQLIVEEELANGVKAARALGGWAAMMDPFSGELLAMAQSKRYTKNMNLISREPGSIIKPLTYSVCLEANHELVSQGNDPVFNHADWLATSNGAFPGRKAPLVDGKRHPFLNLNVAMQKSSNVYSSQTVQSVVDQMGGSWFRKKLVDIFRLSEKLTTEFPNEASGFLPEPGKKEWSIATPHVLGLGYNTLTTSLQMLSAYATFANGGYQVTPFLVPRKEKVIRFNYVFGPRQFGVRSSSYQIRADLCRKLALNPSKKVLHDETISTITEAMKFVTKSGGTSKLAELGSYTEVGKSGTAEKFIDGKYSKTRNVASFIGFAPFSHPRFVLIVSLDEPIRKWTPYGWHQYGGVSSAPIFRNIANRVLKYFGVPVESPEISELFKLRVQEQKAMYEKMKC